MGAVYAARARASGERVALKVLHAELDDVPGGADRFLREAELGRRVDDAHVVRTLGAGRARVGDATLAYLVLEHVEGRPLSALRSSLGRLPEPLLREIARQAAAGLGALHAAGIVHRDIKPENLLVTAGHRLRIADLGVSRPVETTRELTAEGAFIGSLRYAAPEQCRGQVVTPATDLYALGVVLYELAAGEVPFALEDPAALVYAHVHQAPVPLGARNPEIGAFLQAVVMTLLEKEPEARFPSAAALEEALVEGERGAWWEARRRARETTPRARVPVRARASLHGRDAELGRLEAAWRDAREGRGRTVRLLGATGLGKTRLLDALARGREGESAAVLYGSWEADPLEGGLRAALRRHGAGTDLEARFREALGEHADLAPHLAAWVLRAPPPAGAAPLSNDALASLLSRVLAAQARRRPVLFLLDDLDAAGDDDRRGVAALARSLAGQPVLLVLAAEGEGSLDAGTLGEGVETLRLGRLAPAAADALLADVLGPEAAETARWRAVSALGAGVPLFLLALAEEAADGPNGEAVALPASLREQLVRRVDRLDDEAQEILDVAAVAGAHFDAEAVARVRQSPRLRVLEVLGRLERVHGLVRAEGARYRFDHPLVARALYERQPVALKAEIHRLLAEARRGEPPVDPEALHGEDALAWVHHHLRGSEPERALPLISRVITHLDASRREDRVVDVLARTLAVGAVSLRGRVSVGLRLSGSLLQLGRLPEARKAARRVVEDADATGDPELRARARLAAARVEKDASDLDRAVAFLEEALALLREDAPLALRAEAWGVLGQVRWLEGRLDEAAALQERVRDAGAKAGEARIEAQGAADLAVVRHEQGRFEEAEALHRRALALHRAAGVRVNEAVTAGNLGNVLRDRGRIEEAVQAYEESLALSRSMAHRSMEVVALLNHGDALRRLGRLDAAEAELRRAVAICREVAHPREEGYALHALALVERARGDLEGAEAILEEALGLRRRGGDARGLAESLQARAALAAERGEGEAAVRARLDEAEAAARALADARLLALIAVQRAALPGGDVAGAAAFVAAHRAALPADVRAEVEARLADLT